MESSASSNQPNPPNNNPNNPPNQGSAAIPAAQQQNLIRTDQVQKLPHLTDAMKAANTQAVRSLWETINANAAGTPEYNAAHAKLAGISQTLMRQMKSFQYRQMQLQQQQKQMQQVQQQGQGQAQGKISYIRPRSTRHRLKLGHTSNGKVQGI
ncbi:transcription initiation factor TFIID subunit 12 [Histoplasma capsulatum]|uniref:Transcription initiation factor TFIID subunit 12 n=1 Tax=Ajellomyces capsulatus TaxID=5037 RepID=A0A8A1LYT1_AJECA|nr:transcription initiation factor TFIID subunit 12 [Histoplasma capsulatum]